MTDMAIKMEHRDVMRTRCGVDVVILEVPARHKTRKYGCRTFVEPYVGVSLETFDLYHYTESGLACDPLGDAMPMYDIVDPRDVERQEVRLVLHKAMGLCNIDPANYKHATVYAGGAAELVDSDGISAESEALSAIFRRRGGLLFTHTIYFE